MKNTFIIISILISFSILSAQKFDNYLYNKNRMPDSIVNTIDTILIVSLKPNKEDVFYNKKTINVYNNLTDSIIIGKSIHYKFYDVQFDISGNIIRKHGIFSLNHSIIDSTYESVYLKEYNKMNDILLKHPGAYVLKGYGIGKLYLPFNEIGTKYPTVDIYADIANMGIENRVIRFPTLPMNILYRIKPETKIFMMDRYGDFGDDGVYFNAVNLGYKFGFDY